MGGSVLRYSLSFVILLLLQVTVLSNITFLGWACPFLYIYFIMILPTSIPFGWLYTIAFVLGFSMDVFSNTPGMHTIATVTIAGLRYGIFHLYFNRDEIQNSHPGAFKFGMWPFMRFAVTFILIHHFLLLLIESFVLINIGVLLAKVILSSLFTTLLVFCIESIKLARK